MLSAGCVSSRGAPAVVSGLCQLRRQTCSCLFCLPSKTAQTWSQTCGQGQRGKGLSSAVSTGLRGKSIQKNCAGADQTRPLTGVTGDQELIGSPQEDRCRFHASATLYFMRFQCRGLEGLLDHPYSYPAPPQRLLRATTPLLLPLRLGEAETELVSLTALCLPV